MPAQLRSVTVRERERFHSAVSRQLTEPVRLLQQQSLTSTRWCAMNPKLLQYLHITLAAFNL